MPDKRDRQTLEQFANFFSDIGRSGNGVDAWPEDHAEGDIDAIIGQFAIEHTSIDALPEQRLKDSWFSQVIGELEGKFRGKLGFDLEVCIDFYAIDKGQDWSQMNEDLERWIENNSAQLPDGNHAGYTIPGFPFSVHVRKNGLRFDGVRFIRSAPTDCIIAERLFETITRPGRTNKLQKLSHHRDAGKTALLLIESHGISLLSDDILAQAFADAFPTFPKELDELWYVQRVSPNDLVITDLRHGKGWIYDARARLIICETFDAARVSADCKP